jgi:hypothetical protein
LIIASDAVRLIRQVGLIEIKDIGMSIDLEGNIGILIKGLRKTVKISDTRWAKSQLTDRKDVCKRV